MVERILLILKTKDISASKFADKIGVQRSSISHILSGRNNPSLELVQKVLKKFPDINSEWLISGIGPMSKEPDLFSLMEVANNKKTEEPKFTSEIEKMDVFEPELNLASISQKNEPDEPSVKIEEKIREIASNEVSFERPAIIPNKVVESSISGKKVERIVYFFTDKTFLEYIKAD
ncbi:MAG: helix-turn-helix transcriptional regulator [Bacteroidetes bacterium]|nr:helix-turn-helix transcriptional regulator [Bacteroidota bacterium]